MANEAVLKTETEIPISLTCADDTAIAKGTILKLADLGTVSASTAAEDIIGGIAGSDKIADDGMVKIDVHRGGLWRVKASGSISVGDALASDGVGSANYVYSVSATNALAASGSRILGTSFEDATDEDTFLMELRPQVPVQIV